MQTFLISLRSLVLFTLLLGGLYPMTITLLGAVLSPIRSHGSLLKNKGSIVGSELIGQKFSEDKYFWGRPSSADYVPLNSAASQRSATDIKLKEDYSERALKFPKSPADLLWTSASGIDPHISVEAARYQIPRVALARNMTTEALEKSIQETTEDRFLGFMGQPRVNVLELNLLLEKQRN